MSRLVAPLAPGVARRLGNGAFIPYGAAVLALLMLDAVFDAAAVDVDDPDPNVLELRALVRYGIGLAAAEVAVSGLGAVGLAGRVAV